MKITVTRTQLPGVLIVDTPYKRDERGFFLEAWHARDYADAGLDLRFVQDNHSRSQRGVLRGLHFQDMTAPLGKLVRCTAGRIFDVAVDLRAGSPAFGRWIGVELTEENGAAALGAGRLRARVPGAHRSRRGAIQADGVLRAAGRDQHRLGRSRDRRRVAPARPAALGSRSPRTLVEGLRSRRPRSSTRIGHDRRARAGGAPVGARARDTSAASPIAPTTAGKSGRC